MQNPRNLKVWHQARELAVGIYRLTATFPPGERFGLADQMRRASVSVASNIAEGCGRNGNRELLSFLRIALGSATELEVQLLIAADLDLGDPVMRARAAEINEDEKRMLSRLIIGIARRSPPTTKKGAPRAPFEKQQ